MAALQRCSFLGLGLESRNALCLRNRSKWGWKVGVKMVGRQVTSAGLASEEEGKVGLEERKENPMTGWLERTREEEDVLKEECGVVGIFGEPEASRMCFLALHTLQHRGQEGAGIVASEDGVLRSVTGMGLVSEVFNQSKLAALPGSCAIGHCRYATAGASVVKNVQPFVAGYRFGQVAIAHNGNIVNYKELRMMLEERGSIFNTCSDTEVVLHLIATSKARPFIARVVDACEQLEGAYSLVFLTEDKLVAVRDPYGFRPLVMGRRDNGAIIFASETCALDLIEARYVREVNPGEVVVVDKEGTSSLCLMPHRERKACIFEHIYFAMPNSIVFGKSVYQSRYRFGEILAEESPVDCDVVIAVPDSGVVAALGYSAKCGVPFQQGLIRSHYVGRTFIEPSQKIRDFGVKLKLAPVQAVLKGKRVVVVDDSIVRGTTSSKIVRLIKEAGATEVHLRIASPPITGSCYYGVDTPSPEELISYRLDIEDTRKEINADSLAFLPLSRLRSLLGEEAPTFCDACFSGNYPVLTSAMAEDWKKRQNLAATKGVEMQRRGALIVLEGLDRSGKSSQAARLATFLESQGVAVEAWRFPDRSTAVGQMISSYLTSHAELDDAAVHLLFSANRWEKRVPMESKLQAGVTLVVDRYSHSGVAFSAAKGLGLAWCKAAEEGLPAPDLVLYLNISPEAAALRGEYGQERYEKVEFQRQVSLQYQFLRDSTWRDVDATQAVEVVQESIRQESIKVIKSCLEGSTLGHLWQA